MTLTVTSSVFWCCAFYLLAVGSDGVQNVTATFRRHRLSNYQWLLFNGDANNDNTSDLVTNRNSDFLQFRLRDNMQRRLQEIKERRTCGFANCMKSAVVFKYYNAPESTRTFAKDDKIPCDRNGKFAFILHGWKQSCDTEWVHELVERLQEYRGGCIICIDYSLIAKLSYFKLSKSFEIITYTIADKIQALMEEGFDPQKGYMFGFSFGGQLATAVGQLLGPDDKFKNIDTCDMAGPGFDIKFPNVDHRSAADNVQCFHSSADKGTLKYECHQNIRFGNCGYSQPAVASQTRYGSHGLCVQMYINAFEFPFYALPRQPFWCTSVNPAEDIPEGYTVGYRDVVDVQGEVFVPTGMNFPYNLSLRELARMDF